MKKSHELSIELNRLDNIRNGDIILVCTLRNEANRIVYFVNYYRALGVDHFIFIDNESTDDFLDIVQSDNAISVFNAKGSYKDSNFGIDWVNYVSRKYCSNHWCLTVDPDELLVYSKYETHNLRKLANYLEKNNVQRLHSILLDMYSEKPLSQAIYKRGQNPLEVCPYFDAEGYIKRKNYQLLNLWIQGGPRRRKLFAQDKGAAPALNKIPFVKWKWNYCYLSSTHAIAPIILNEQSTDASEATSCLMHFKFISELTHKAEEELLKGEHYSDSREYKEYIKLASNEDLLIYENSVKFENSQQLEELNLMNSIDYL